jgi:2-polyprenyl-6-methoxyphenol hydroxylase-like FAD-dependent oxidoreductase
MRNVLIVGAGTSGLTLAHLLLASGEYAVTVAATRGPEEIRTGGVLSSQVLFDPAQRVLRRAGLDEWADLAPQIPSLDFRLVNPDGTIPLSWTGQLAYPASSVDQRTTHARWLTRIAAHDRGSMVTGPLSIERVGHLSRAQRYDLVVVAAGHSPVADLFPVDPRYTAPDPRPARSLAMVYLDGVAPGTRNVVFTVVPGYGEIIFIPALTGTRPCHIVLIEAIPTGEWDRFTTTASDPALLLRDVRDILGRWAPDLAERCRDAVLTDHNATLTGAVTPLVRQPVAQLESGVWAVAMGDTAAPRDPLSATGANDAIRAAQHVATSLLDHGPGPITPGLLHEVTHQFFQQVTLPSLRWTDILLAPPPQVQAALAQAMTDPPTADAIVALFPDPSQLAAQPLLPVPHATALGEASSTSSPSTVP